MASTRLFRHGCDLTTALQTGLPQSEGKSGRAGFFEAIYAVPLAGPSSAAIAYE